MYPEHPWQGERYGGVEYEWFLRRTYEVGAAFEVRLQPFVDFCRTYGHRSNQLTMKLAARLSTQHLPQRMLALNGRPYPTRYPAGYVRPVRDDGSDMLEHIAVVELPDQFAERNVRDKWQPPARWLATHAPRLAVWLARWIFPRDEVRGNYALMVSRNPLRSLDTRVIVLGSHVRTMALAIPYGSPALCTFLTPHAFGNINYFEPFLREFKTYMEEPGQIPSDLLEKPYVEAPRSE